jgi:hypothetical protein
MSNVSWPNLSVKAQHIIATKEGGEAHCGVNNESLEHQIMFDSLDDVFN